MKNIFLVIILFALPVEVFATAQIPDYLIYEGDKLPLHVNPLEQFFEKQKKKRPKGGSISSANWRGYVAVFKIESGDLIVSDLTIRKPNPEKKYDYLTISVVDSVFPSEKDRIMNWFSGLLVVPRGKRIAYVHLSYASLYESYLLLKIKNGSLIESASLTFKDYIKYKRKQFELYKQTEDYKAQIKKLSKDLEPGSDFDLEGFLFQWGKFAQFIDIPLPNE